MVCVGYMYDLVEDIGVILDDIKELFGLMIVMIVDGDIKIFKIYYKFNKEQMVEIYWKLLFVMSKDIWVMIVKLVDCLYNMWILKYLCLDK